MGWVETYLKSHGTPQDHLSFIHVPLVFGDYFYCYTDVAVTSPIPWVSKLFPGAMIQLKSFTILQVISGSPLSVSCQPSP